MFHPHWLKIIFVFVFSAFQTFPVGDNLIISFNGCNSVSYKGLKVSNNGCVIGANKKLLSSLISLLLI